MNEPLKNMYNRQYVSDLAAAIEYPDFNGEAFLACVINDDWEARELKERMRHITTVLHDFLPADYRSALDVLYKASTSLGDATPLWWSPCLDGLPSRDIHPHSISSSLSDLSTVWHVQLWQTSRTLPNPVLATPGASKGAGTDR